MTRKCAWVMMVLLGLSGLAMAQDAAADAPAEHEEATAAEQVDTWVLMGICLAGATAVIGGGLSIARLGKAAIESIARQPEASGAMFAPMIITAAMIEGAMMLAIIMCFLAVFRV
jgi:F-type H+-transporting ATPase subunit c